MIIQHSDDMAYSYLYAMILAFYKLTRKLNKFNTLLLPSLAATPDAALSSASLSVYIPSSSGGLSRFSTGTYTAHMQRRLKRQEEGCKHFFVSLQDLPGIPLRLSAADVRGPLPGGKRSSN